MTRLFVLLSMGQDPAVTALAYAEGRAPDRVPYGFHFAEEEGFAVTYSASVAGGERGLARRIALRALGVDIVHAWRNRRAIRAADVIWAMSERESLAVALLMRLSIVPRRPILSSSVWIWSDWHRTGMLRRRYYRFLLRAIAAMSVQSERCLPIARRAVPWLSSPLMPFGINDERFPPLEDARLAEGPLRILAAGNDPTRDWATLLEAVGGDPRFEVRLICPWVTPESVAPYPNVTLPDGRDLEAFRAHYRWADIVAVPMVANDFSGITVALEAAALGRAILSSDTGGIETYFSRDEVIFVPVGDAGAMRARLAALSREDFAGYAARARHRYVTADYTTRRMIGDYARFTRAVTG